MIENESNRPISCNCCGSEQEVELLGRIRELVGAVPAQGGLADPGAAYGAGHLRLSADRGAAGGFATVWGFRWPKYRCCILLFLFHHPAAGEVSTPSGVSRNGLLCTRREKDHPKSLRSFLGIGIAKQTPDRRFYPGGCQMHRRVRACARVMIDDEVYKQFSPIGWRPFCRPITRRGGRINDSDHQRSSSNQAELSGASWPLSIPGACLRRKRLCVGRAAARWRRR